MTNAHDQPLLQTLAMAAGAAVCAEAATLPFDTAKVCHGFHQEFLSDLWTCVMATGPNSPLYGCVLP